MDDIFTINFDLSIGYINYKFIKDTDNTYNIIRTQYLMNFKKKQWWKNINSNEVDLLKKEFTKK